jgi:hypothetical protein
MTIAEQIYEKVKQLPPERQAKVLDFAEGLAAEAGEKRPPLNGPIGVLSHLRMDVSEEDIAEARREMWGSFPRDLPE